jgi:hypothetical protein
MRAEIRLFRFLASAAVLFGTAIGCSSPSNALVNQIVIDSAMPANYNPIPLGSSTPGSSVSYTIYTGRIFGTLSSNSFNSVITDLSLASPVGGSSSYIAQFTIITPTIPSLRSGLLIHEVPNRGGNAINTSALIAGATYVESGWQGDLLTQCSGGSGSLAASAYPCVTLTSSYGTATASFPFFAPPTGLADFVIQVPVATTDANPPDGSNNITGQVYGHVCTGNNGCGLAVGSAATSTAQLQIQAPAFVPYQPASYDTTQATLSTVPSQTLTGVDGTQTPISSADWAWAYCPSGWPGTPNPNWICLNGATFDPTLLYEVTYTAANPLVLGVGFAAFRDLASFLKYGTTAPGGGSNPIAGSITKAMIVGASQSAAFIHGFIFYGFNEDESSRTVFDGAWPQIDGRMMVMNIRWGQPNNLMYLYMGGDEAPVWWADYPNMARSLSADGMLHQCTATSTCPQILETFGSAELYSEKMSVALCGFTCVADIPLPSNVYRYYSPGATHGGGAVSFTWSAPGSITPPAGQSLPSDPIPETYTNNALQADFIEWLMSGTTMPSSAYPTLASGELVLNNAIAEGFPNIPGFTFAGDQAWPPFVYDFGPGENYDQESGIPTIEPPNITQVLSVYATTVNADGNENVSGLPTVLGQAPLGTYVGWNLASTGWYGPNASNGPSSVGQVIAGAGGSGGFWPFWDTKANRIANDDPRLSLEERYGTSAGYNCVVAAVANAAVAQRFLLSSDATTLINLAAATNVLAAPFAPNTADVVLTDVLCRLAPAVAQVAPNNGTGAGGTTVSISGNYFTGATLVNFGSAPATSFVVNSATSITATAPPGTGIVNVTVYTPAAISTTSAADQFTYTYAIDVSASPAAGGTVSGGGAFLTGSSQTVTATPNVGYIFTSWTQNGNVVSTSANYNFTLTANTTLVANFQLQNYRITVSVPHALEGTASGGGTFPANASRTVSATGKNGHKFVNWTENGAVVSTSANYNFTLTANRNLSANFVVPSGRIPTVTAVAPNTGPSAGGTSVTITGTNFTGGAPMVTVPRPPMPPPTSPSPNPVSVNFGTVPAASFTISSATSISAVSPAGSGTVDVTVSNPAGTSATSAADHFIYDPPSHDFNADGKSDIVWRDAAGDVELWLMNGRRILQRGSLGNVPPAWLLIGQRDFAGGGKAGLLWQDVDGNLSLWSMNGLQVAAKTSLGSVPLRWTLAGTGDLNGDGTGDLLWRDSATGAVSAWLMQGAQVAAQVDLGAMPADWTIIGDDNKGDIFWRDAAGDLALWQVSGAQVVAKISLGTMPTNWQAAGLGDFAGNGSTDILWRDSNSGAAAISFLNGAGIASTVSLGTVAPSWSIVQTGDYDGGGKTDILWADNSGNVMIWFMDGGTRAATATFPAVATTWQAQSRNAE